MIRRASPRGSRRGLAADLPPLWISLRPSPSQRALPSRRDSGLAAPPPWRLLPSLALPGTIQAVICWLSNERIRRRQRRLSCPLAVLIVDDEPIIRMYTRLLFLDAGFVSIEAATADEGLGIPERDDVRLVFTDVEIPGSTLNGLDLVEVVRKNGRGSS
jgi:hypothetical protein